MGILERLRESKEIKQRIDKWIEYTSVDEHTIRHNWRRIVEIIVTMDERISPDKAVEIAKRTYPMGKFRKIHKQVYQQAMYRLWKSDHTSIDKLEEIKEQAKQLIEETGEIPDNEFWKHLLSLETIAHTIGSKKVGKLHIKIQY